MPSTKAEVRQLESKILGTPDGIKKNLPLLSALLGYLSTDVVHSWEVHDALVHSLRRIFTFLHHSGALEVGGGTKLVGAEKARVLTKWLRSQFSTYLGLLVRLLVEGSKGEGSNRVEARILALTTIIHFFAHAAPLEEQAAAGGPYVCQGVVVWFMRQIMTAGGAESMSLYSHGGQGKRGAESFLVEERLLPLLTCDLGTAAATFRSQFMDDYDDLRLASLKALKEVCDEKRRVIEDLEKGGGVGLSAQRKKRSLMQSKEGIGSDGSSVEILGGDESGIGGEALARNLIHFCHPLVFSRNAMDFLLQVSLPRSQIEWDESRRASWGEEQLKKHLVNVRRETESSAADSKRDPSPKPPSNVKYLKDCSDEEEEEFGEEGRGDPRGLTSEIATLHQGFSWKDQKNAYGEALLSILRLPLAPDVYRRLLLALPRRILPLLPPRMALQLSDFLTEACNRSGASALLGLESLFYLMQHHGLEYPDFYARLYTLLGSPDTVHAKYRGKFSSLLAKWMGSTLLPAYLAAAFVKRALRLSLSSPVGVALWALPFTYNLLKRHPKALLCLVHRVAGDAEPSSWPEPVDPFIPHINDPSASRALESSLWEIMLLAQHAYAPVAHAARGLLGELNKEEHDLSEDSTPLASTYSQLITSEFNRTIASSSKKVGEMGSEGGKVPPPVPFLHVLEGTREGAANFDWGGESSLEVLSWI